MFVGAYMATVSPVMAVMTVVALATKLAARVHATCNRA